MAIKRNTDGTINMNEFEKAGIKNVIALTLFIVD